MSVKLYTPDANVIVHETKVDFRRRVVQRQINLVQYDKSMPVIAVKLCSNGNEYVLPENASAYIRFGKRDHTYVYNECLGCDQTRTIVYFAITDQMTVFYGEHTPIVELRIGDTVAGSGSIPIWIDRNPIQNGDTESKSDLSVFEKAIEAAKKIADSGGAFEEITATYNPVDPGGFVGSRTLTLDKEPTGNNYILKAGNEKVLMTKVNPDLGSGRVGYEGINFDSSSARVFATIGTVGYLDTGTVSFLFNADSTTNGKFLSYRENMPEWVDAPSPGTKFYTHFVETKGFGEASGQSLYFNIITTVDHPLTVSTIIYTILKSMYTGFRVGICFYSENADRSSVQFNFLAFMMTYLAQSGKVRFRSFSYATDAEGDITKTIEIPYGSTVPTIVNDTVTEGINITLD